MVGIGSWIPYANPRVAEHTPAPSQPGTISRENIHSSTAKHVVAGQPTHTDRRDNMKIVFFNKAISALACG